jgi:endonuclease/exonuclease/phosphatase family metal-dependent hydrolase
MDEVKIQNYHSPSPDLMEVDESQKRATIRHVLLSMKTVYDGVPFPIATTHFTWTPNGLSDENQKIDAEALFALLSDIPDVLLCGDFNIPRGHNELYEKFTALYEDAIPKSYASSLDLSLHKSGRDPIQGPNLAKYMVDYLFLSKGYGAENVRLEPGVSDHMGIVATVLAKTQGR